MTSYPPAWGLRTHWCGELRPGHAGQTVALCGWVARRREHGEHLAFLDLRDREGVVQCVIDGSVDVRNEWVVRVTGVVRTRPDRAKGVGPAHWVILSGNAGFQAGLAREARVAPRPDGAATIAWSDDDSSLFELLK